VIWGYGENALGFLVGNLATLRSLFRKVFGFGGSSTQKATLAGNSKADSGSAFPSNSSRTYEDVEVGTEFGLGSRYRRDKYGMSITMTKWDETDSISETGSQKQILEGQERLSPGIVVNRSVNVSHE